jgi:hypothetical protein
VVFWHAAARRKPAAAGGISLDIYWLSSPCRLSQENSFKGQIEGKGPKKNNGKITLGAGCVSHFIGTVEPSRRPPKRVRNDDVRAREYLTNAEVDRLIAKKTPLCAGCHIARPALDGYMFGTAGGPR